jgi:hypothetical protein
MTDGGHRQPAVNEAPHAIPEDAAVLASRRQRAMPKPADSEPHNLQRLLVHGHSVIPDVPTPYRLQPLAQFRDGFVHPTLMLGFRLQPFAYRLPQYGEPSIAPFLHADVRKTLKIGCGWKSLAIPARARLS